MEYEKIIIEPHSYEMHGDLKIPKQPSPCEKRNRMRDPKVKEMAKLGVQIQRKLDKKLKDAITPKSRNCIWGDMDKRLSFLVIPDPGKLSTNHCIVANFKDSLARILFLKENGLQLDDIRYLCFASTDKEWAISLQFLRDNGIDIQED